VQCNVYNFCAGHCDWQTDANQAATPEKEYVMVKNFDEMQKVGQESADTAMKSFGMVSNHMQMIATAMADYSKKSFDDATKVFEQLLGTKSVEKAIELQQSYFKSAYEGFVAQATKIGGLYTDLAKETYKPFEGFVAKNTSAK
jgi:hypothetical protein